MKGYLNGGVFSEEYLNLCSQHFNERSAFESLINFEKYCREHLPDEPPYLSLHMMTSQVSQPNERLREIILAIAGAPPEDEGTFSFNDYSHFTNSFRIIAKQNSFQKSDSLFLLDPDFDVFYTLNPDPIYQEALEKFQAMHGRIPEGYLHLQMGCEVIASRIHDHLSQFPLCKKYFSMLGVINFFSSYFTTLKAHDLVPNLDPMQIPGKLKTSTLFPHLPLGTIHEQSFKLEYKNIFLELKFFHKEILSNFLADFRSEETSKILTPTAQAHRDTDQNIAAKRNALLSEIEKLVLQYAKKQNPNPWVHRGLDENFSQPNSRLKKIAKEYISFLENVFNSFIKGRNYFFHISSLTSTISDFIQNCNLRDIEFPSYKSKFPVIQLPFEMTPEERKKATRLVGGCGMNLKPQKASPTDKSDRTLSSIWSHLNQLPSETWNSVNQSGIQGSFFSLNFNEAPFDRDYQWMESLIQIEQNEMATSTNLEKILQTIQNDDIQGFVTVCNELKERCHFKDNLGRTLVHFTAQHPNPFYIKHLLTLQIPHTIADDHGFCPIHYATLGGGISQIEAILTSYPDQINTSNSQGITPLMVAIQHEKIDAALYLIDHSTTDFISQNSNGYTILHIALHCEEKVIIRKLLSKVKKSEINTATKEQITPLMLAVELDDPSIIQKMIELGANLSFLDSQGHSAFDVAIQRQCVNTARLLIHQSPITDKTIHLTAKLSSPEFIRLFLDNDQFCRYLDKDKNTLLMLTLYYGNYPAALYLIEKMKQLDMIEMKNNTNDSALSMAIERGFGQVINALIECNVEIEPNTFIKGLSQAGYPQLFDHFSHYYEMCFDETKVEAFELVLKRGRTALFSPFLKKLDQRTAELTTSNGWKAIHYFAKNDALSQLRPLVIRSQDPFHRLSCGKTLPYIAAESGSEDVLNFLIKWMQQKNIFMQCNWNDHHLLYAAFSSLNLQCIRQVMKTLPNVNVPLDRNRTTAAHLAAKFGIVEILEELQKQGVNLSSPDQRGNPPLFYASLNSTNPAKAYLMNLGLEFTATNVNMNTQLHSAAQNGATSEIQELLHAGLSIDAEDENGQTPLFYAIVANRQNTALFLIENGASLSHRDHSLMTPLSIAINKKNIPMIRLLFNQGANPNQYFSWTRETILNHLLQSDLEILSCEAMYRYGASPEIQNSKGVHAAHIASQKKFITATRFLSLYANAFDTPDNFDRSASEISSIEGATEILKIMKTHDQFDPMFTTSSAHLENTLRLGKFETAQWLLSNGIHHHFSNSQWEKVYVAAAQSNQPQMIELLMKYKQIHEGNLLSVALISAIGSDSINSLAFLYTLGFSLDMAITDSYTPLHIASQYGSIKATQFLLRYGANTLQRTNNGATALEIAAANSSVEQFRLLLRHINPVPNESNIRGQTLLHIAAKQGNASHLFLLLDSDFEVDAKDHLGNTPLYYSIKDCRVKASKLLLHAGADVNPFEMPQEIIPIFDEFQTHRNAQKEGENLLHLAVRSSWKPACALHLNHIDVNAQDHLGKTPLHLAIELENFSIARYLIEHGADISIQDKNHQTILQYLRNSTHPEKELFLQNLRRI